MTLRYSHLAPSHKVKAVDILDSTLNEKPTIQKLYSLGQGYSKPFLLLYSDTWYIITYMKAKPFIMRKRVYPNGDIIEIKAWQVTETPDKPHGFKYSLVYIREGKRIIGYDNSERKGDHRHYKDNIYPYNFKGIDKLFEDFFNDARRVNHED